MQWGWQQRIQLAGVEDGQLQRSIACIRLRGGFGGATAMLRRRPQEVQPSAFRAAVATLNPASPQGRSQVLLLVNAQTLFPRLADTMPLGCLPWPQHNRGSRLPAAVACGAPEEAVQGEWS